MSDRTETVLGAIDDAVDEWDDWNGYSADSAHWEPEEQEAPEAPMRVRWCPEVADPAAPTVAELDAGIDLTEHIAPPPGSMAAEVEALQVRVNDMYQRLAAQTGCTVDEVRDLAESLGRYMVVPGHGRMGAFRRMRLEVTEREVRECARQICEAAGVPHDVVGLEDTGEGEPTASEEFRALDARRNRNTGPARTDNRRWRNQ